MIGTKKCTNCKTDKPHSEFYVIKRKDRVKPQLYRHCKSCCPKIKSNNKDYYRDYELRKKYGIDIEQYREQMAIRNNACDICKDVVSPMHVDHSHTTGKVRGYLCGPCNRAIGMLKDRSDICEAAAMYLKSNGD